MPISKLSQSELIQKYNVPGPRYTSYPTVPFWNDKTYSNAIYQQKLFTSFDQNGHKGISLYIHLPFCESMCTFCACNKRITKNHEVEQQYIGYLRKEWQMYLRLLERKPILAELHLGGGTPSFFSAENLKGIISEIIESCELHHNPEFSFEGHPNNTTSLHLQSLYDLGFRRVSFGVQDYDTKVQKAIHRHQPFSNVAYVTQEARRIGYQSISHDLVYGLPFQTEQSIIDTIELSSSLSPDRLSFYSYAHVPWIKGVGQRGFDEKDLPNPQLKRKLYERGKSMLETLGYKEIGMDHFALSHDSMYIAMEDKVLHRNFMGYTTTNTDIMIGLGVSAISDCKNAFAQNLKTIEEYYSTIDTGQLPLFRGHLLTDQDTIIRRHILNIICQFYTSWQEESAKFEGLQQSIELWEEMVGDGLIVLGDNDITVTKMGKAFVRNICMAIDHHLLNSDPQIRLFSMTV